MVWNELHIVNIYIQLHSVFPRLNFTECIYKFITLLVVRHEIHTLCKCHRDIIALAHKTECYQISMIMEALAKVFLYVVTYSKCNNNAMLNRMQRCTMRSWYDAVILASTTNGNWKGGKHHLGRQCDIRIFCEKWYYKAITK